MFAEKMSKNNKIYILEKFLTETFQICKIFNQILNNLMRNLKKKLKMLTFLLNNLQNLCNPFLYSIGFPKS